MQSSNLISSPIDSDMAHQIFSTNDSTSTKYQCEEDLSVLLHLFALFQRGFSKCGAALQYIRLSVKNAHCDESDLFHFFVHTF